MYEGFGDAQSHSTQLDLSTAFLTTAAAAAAAAVVFIVVGEQFIAVVSDTEAIEEELYLRLSLNPSLPFFK